MHYAPTFWRALALACFGAILVAATRESLHIDMYPQSRRSGAPARSNVRNGPHKAQQKALGLVHEGSGRHRNFNQATFLRVRLFDPCSSD